MMKKRVFITGATGTMGWAGLQEFMQRLDRFDITVLARPSKKNKEKLAPYADRIRIVWGDLTKYEDVLNATKGKKERVGRILQMHANKREELDKVYSGDIAAAVGFKVSDVAVAAYVYPASVGTKCER